MPALKLTREPALVAVAQDPGDIGRRAAALLPQLDWPGKPGAAAATPLTPEEQQRFETGREVYQTLCAACHQPDGRGREHLAPSLIGSELALGSSGIPVRIVLNGKEGSTGLMPPLGRAQRRPDCSAHLHPPRMGPLVVSSRSNGGQADPRADRRPHEALDRRRA